MLSFELFFASFAEPLRTLRDKLGAVAITQSFAKKHKE
jgi:hypothetical protein